MKTYAAIRTLCLSLCFFIACLGGCAKPFEPTSNNIPNDEISDSINDNTDDGENNMPVVIDTIFMYFDDKRLEIKLYINSSVNALVNILQNGDIVYTANDYGGFEKVGNIGHTLPTNNTQMTAVAGDVVLYQGNQICIFVGSNTWSYTKLGRIDCPVDELRSLLKINDGSLEIIISLR